MKLINIRSIIFLLLITISGQVLGQRFSQPSLWLRYRHQVSVAAGGSFFLGELGGSIGDASNFYKDIDWNATKYAIQINYRYNLTRKNIFRVSLTYAEVTGHDKYTNNIYRRNRNIHFKSAIAEGAIYWEYHILEPRLNNLHSIGRTGGRSYGKRFVPIGIHAFGGVAGFYYDPKAQFEGTWVSLQPLGTEGQGLPGGATPYSNFSLAIPFGIGVSYHLSREVSIGFEFGHRLTFTDYIDDVSTVYYDKDAIANATGDIASFLSDPSTGNPSWTTAGEQRGSSKNNDSYMFGLAYVNYKIKNRSRGYRGRRRGKVKARF